MKKIYFFLAFVLLLTLSACKVAPTEEPLGKSLEAPAQQWEYQWVTVRCVFDGGTSEVVCVDLKTGDGKYLGNLLGSISTQGYELDEVVHSSDKGGMIQTFIFRRPFVASVAQE